jgi:hypothetical protein
MISNTNLENCKDKFLTLQKAYSDLFARFIAIHPDMRRYFLITQISSSDFLKSIAYEKLGKDFERFLTIQSHPLYTELPIEYFTQGSIIVGYNAFNPRIPVLCDIEGLSGHILNSSTTGGGKSVWNLNIISSIIRLYPDTHLRVIVIAPKKYDDHRNLVINNVPGSVLFLDMENLAIRPFDPIKNVKYELVIANLCRVVASSVGQFAAGQLYLQKCMFEFLGKYPTESFLKFIDWLSERQERSPVKRNYLDSLQVKLVSVMLEINKVFDVYRGIDDKVWIAENLVVEIHTSSSFVQSLISGILLNRLFLLKTANNE